MDNGDKIEEKGIISSKYLMVILLIFAILIIGLVIAIILFRDSSKNDDGHYSNENNIEASDFESNDEYLEMLEENDRSYQKSLEISEIYNSGDKEKAFNMYNEELNRALEFQDFGFYNDLVTAMSTMLSLDGTCEELMAQYDKIDIDRIPVDYREPIYANAIYDSTNCGDAEREAYWREKTNE